MSTQPEPRGREAWGDRVDDGGIPTAGPYADHGQPPRKRRRRVFLWVFLVVQALFIVWLVTGITSVASDTACDPTLSREACDAARGIGGGIGAALVFALWVGVDIIMGIGYGIYRLAGRRR